MALGSYTTKPKVLTPQVVNNVPLNLTDGSGSHNQIMGTCVSIKTTDSSGNEVDLPYGISKDDTVLENMEFEDPLPDTYSNSDYPNSSN